MNRWSLTFLVSLLSLASPSWTYSQGSGMTVPSITPAPLIRLIGVLEAVEDPRITVFPVLRVWIAGHQWLFRVAQAESVISAYRAQDRLREVSSLGLRFVATTTLLVTLQNPEMHDRPIIIEGWLRVKAGVLQIRSVQVAEAPSHTP